MKKKAKINIIYKFYGYIFYRFYRYYVDKDYKKDMKRLRQLSGTNVLDKMVERDRWEDGAKDAINWMSCLILYHFIPLFEYLYRGPEKARRTTLLLIFVPLTFALDYILRKIFIKTKRYKVFVNRWKNEPARHRKIGIITFWTYIIFVFLFVLLI